MTYYLIDDQGRELGGAEMTLQAICEDKNVEVIRTKELGEARIDSPEGIILGNICDLSTRSSVMAMHNLIETARFVKIEFDYGYIPYRGRIPFKMFTGMQYTPDIDKVKIEFYQKIRRHAVGIFYMSKAQRRIYKRDLGEAKGEERVLSSQFTEKNYELFRELRNEPRNNYYCIINGQDQWQSWCKGVDASYEWAHSKDKQVKLLNKMPHDSMLLEIARSQGLILMPNIQDTCPRTAIEAKLCGVEFHGNENVQHGDEIWFGGSPEQIEEYLKERKELFWSIVRSPCGTEV